MLDKILGENNCDLELAVLWSVNAKNSLINIHGFSPYQLDIGTNPKLPLIHTAKGSALTSTPTNKIIYKNLQAIQKEREAFIASKNSKKLRCALSHNIRTSGDVKYLTGDSVYFKRLDSNSWHGPAKVLGQDGQQVLVKNGSRYIRVTHVDYNSLTIKTTDHPMIYHNHHKNSQQTNSQQLTHRSNPLFKQMMIQIRMTIIPH